MKINRTRERILDKSIELFNRKQASNVSTVQISTALEISPGNLYYYYTNKEEVIRCTWKERMVPEITEILETAEEINDKKDLEQYLKDYYADDNHEHMARPGMVYISHPSEYGTLYSKAELEALSSVCKTYELPLFMDGARLGYGLMSKDTDVTLPDIAKLCDVFYIGGTKVGALCGEAVVFTHGNMPKHFLTTVKQHGALNAKGRLLGVQFDTLFTDDLYFEISKHAIEMAEKLKKAFKEKGYQFLIDSPTNQIFVILDNEKKKELEKEARFGFWEKYDETHTVVRIATSWGTTEEELNALIELI